MKLLRKFKNRLSILCDFDVCQKEKSWIDYEWLLKPNGLCPLVYAWENDLTIRGLSSWEYALANNLKFSDKWNINIHPVVFYHYRVLSMYDNQQDHASQLPIQDKDGVESLVAMGLYYINGCSIIEKIMRIKNHIVKQ